MDFTTVVLVRGINVGGNNRLAMADLRAAITAVGGGECSTYIQSGNAVCERDVDPTALAAEIEQRAGFRPTVITLAQSRFVGLVAAAPFDLSAQNGKATHLYIAQKPFEFDLTAARQLATTNEAVDHCGQTVYLWAPDGVGRSKLATQIERFTAEPLTARNARTSLRLVDMLTPG